MTINYQARCPCCHEKMLRHISRNEFYWFCTKCRQRMPSFKENTDNRSTKYQKHNDRAITK